jgi:uncharacterized protein
MNTPINDPRFAALKGKIIDFRLRPPTGAYRVFFSEVLVGRACGIFGNPQVPASYRKSLEGKPDSDDLAIGVLIEEMNASGICLGIMNGRHSPNRAVPVHIYDADLKAISDKVGGRFQSLAGIDLDQPIDTIVSGIDHAVKELGMLGVCIEPGLARKAMYAEDERLMPIYQKVSDLGVPLMFMSGPLAGPDNTHTDPVHFERVARTFPKMPVVLGHGAYPYVTESIALAFKSQMTGAMNVYLSPDVYMFAPGGNAYVEAIDFMPERMLFGSAYAFCGVDVAVARNLAFPISDEALPKYMYQNAARILRLPNQP